MTLIAGFCCEGVQVLLADGLVTNLDGRDKPYVQLPAFGPVAAIKAKRSGIEGLAQKINFVGRNMAVALAGRMKAAETVITALQRRSASKEFTQDLLSAFLASKGPLLDRAALIGLINVETTAGSDVRPFEVHSESFRSLAVGPITAAGTGVPLLRSLTERLQSEEAAARLLPSDYKAACKALVVCGLLTAQEFHDGSTISHYSGGTYEVAYFSAGRFVKPDVTYVVWTADLRKGHQFRPLPKLIIKNRYFGEDLFVNAARWGEAGDKIEENTWNFDLHYIPTIANREVDLGISTGMDLGKRIGFSSALTVNIFVVQLEESVELVPHLEVFASRLQVSFPTGEYFVHWGAEMEEWVTAIISTKSAACERAINSGRTSSPTRS